MRKVIEYLFDSEEPTPDTRTSPTIPTRKKVKEDIRFYNELLEPAFVSPGFLTPSSFGEDRPAPLELAAIQEQGLDSDLDLEGQIRQRTTEDIREGRDAYSRTGAARGIYQRELPFTQDAVGQLRKQEWMIDNAFSQILDSGSEEDLSELQFLNSLLKDKTLSDRQLAQKLQDLSSSQYSPLIDTMLHLATTSRGTRAPRAYSNLQQAGMYPDFEDITTIQRQAGGTTDKKRQMLEDYMRRYYYPYSDNLLD